MLFSPTMDPTPTPMVFEIFTEVTFSKSDFIQTIGPVVLAVFAVLAFLVQRSRFLIETDILAEIEVKTASFNMKQGTIISRSGKLHHPALKVDLKIKNMSSRQLNFSAFPVLVTPWSPMFDTFLCELESFGTRISDVPVGQSRDMSRYFVFGARHLLDGAKVVFSVNYPIKLDYKRDLLQALVQPWTLGRRSIFREIIFYVEQEEFDPSQHAPPLTITSQNVFLYDGNLSKKIKAMHL